MIFIDGRGSLAKAPAGTFFRDSVHFLFNHTGYLLSVRIGLAKLDPAMNPRWFSVFYSNLGARSRKYIYAIHEKAFSIDRAAAFLQRRRSLLYLRWPLQVAGLVLVRSSLFFSGEHSRSGLFGSSKNLPQDFVTTTPGTVVRVCALQDVNADLLSGTWSCLKRG